MLPLDSKTLIVETSNWPQLKLQTLFPDLSVVLQETIIMLTLNSAGLIHLILNKQFAPLPTTSELGTSRNFWRHLSFSCNISTIGWVAYPPAQQLTKPISRLFKTGASTGSAKDRWGSMLVAIIILSRTSKRSMMIGNIFQTIMSQVTGILPPSTYLPLWKFSSQFRQLRW